MAETFYPIAPSLWPLIPFLFLFLVSAGFSPDIQGSEELAAILLENKLGADDVSVQKFLPDW